MPPPGDAHAAISSTQRTPDKALKNDFMRFAP
jgi:hypothetical protein